MLRRLHQSRDRDDSEAGMPRDWLAAGEATTETSAESRRPRPGGHAREVAAERFFAGSADGRRGPVLLENQLKTRATIVSDTRTPISWMWLERAPIEILAAHEGLMTVDDEILRVLNAAEIRKVDEPRLRVRQGAELIDRVRISLVELRVGDQADSNAAPGRRANGVENRLKRLTRPGPKHKTARDRGWIARR